MLGEVFADDALELLPELSIEYNGDCAQALGVNLPVAVINLAHRTDKWRAITGRMAAVGLNKLIKVPAVEGARLSLGAIAPLLGQPVECIEAAPRSHFTLTRPAVGCFLSHLAVWRWTIEQNLPRVLVVEDDANPAADFDPVRLRNTLTALPEDLPLYRGLVFLGRIIMNGMADRAEGAELARLYFFNGTFAYLITPAACRALIPRLLPMNGHIDHELSTVLVKHRNEFAAHYVEPAFFEPDWSLRSDCYIPLDDQGDADKALGAFLAASRRTLEADGRPLLPPFV